MLAEVLGVERVPVDGNFFDDLGADSMVMARFCARVRKRSDLRPVSMKDVYQHPSVRSLSDAVAVLPAAVLPPPAPTGLESAFAEVLAEVLGVERVPVDGDFFDDLGADSMVMARFCARVRKRSDLPPVSMKDVYQHPHHAEPGEGRRGRGAGQRGVGACPGGRRRIRRRRPAGCRRPGRGGDTRRAVGTPGADGARDAGAAAAPARGRTRSAAPCSSSSFLAYSCLASFWST